jgi:hypothetical protein
MSHVSSGLKPYIMRILTVPSVTHDWQIDRNFTVLEVPYVHVNVTNLDPQYITVGVICSWNRISASSKKMGHQRLTNAKYVSEQIM